MPRADRLLRLLHALRMLPAPVTAARLAEETGVALRTLYRDIAALRATGVDIEGERGYGYWLVADHMLPPQTFDRLEIEALVLGMSEVAQMGDVALATAARSVLAKIEASIAEPEERQLVHAISKVHRFDIRYDHAPCLPTVREACWAQRALSMRYRDRQGRKTDRRIWPLSIVYLERRLMVLAWCCLREGFRMFQADRIESAVLTDESFRPRRVPMLRDYLAELRDRAAGRA